MPFAKDTRVVTIPTFQVQIGDKWFKLGDVLVELAGLEDTDDRNPNDVTEPYLGRILENLQVIKEHQCRVGYIKSTNFDSFNQEMKALDKTQGEAIRRTR
jgi:hypothetical protein